MDNIPVPVEHQGSASESPQDGQESQQTNKQTRACETCRRLKIRCIVDDDSPDGSCRKCIKSKQRCIMHVPASRQRKKAFKADSRVGELEKKMEALVTAFEATNRQNLPVSSTATSSTDSPAKSANTNVSLTVMDNYGILNIIDLVDQGVMDIAQTHYFFAFWRDTLAPLNPMVVISPSISPETIRRQQPILFLATIVAASSVLDYDLHDRLLPQMRNILANRALSLGTPSLEVIKALIVNGTHQAPLPGPGRETDRSFNHIVHSTALMAMDMGLGRASSRQARRLWHDPTDQEQINANSDVIDHRRIWVSAYLGVSFTATILRRQCLLQWNAYLDECLEVLTTAQDALPSDRWLCHLARAQHILEEASNQFGMNDPMSQVSVTDWNTQNMLKYLTEKMKDWRANVTSDMPQILVELIDAHVMLCIHEIAMRQGHDHDDFRPPFAIDPEKLPSSGINPVPNSSAHISSLTICLRSIHRVFDAIINEDIYILRILPTIIYVRVLYAAALFVKLGSLTCSQSPLGSVFTIEDLKLEEYFDQLVKKLTEASDDGQHRILRVFLRILLVMRLWLSKVGPPPRSQQPCRYSELKGASTEQMPLPNPSQTWSNAPANTATATDTPVYPCLDSSTSQSDPQTFAPAPSFSTDFQNPNLGMDMNLDWYSMDILTQMENEMDWTAWDMATGTDASMFPGAVT